MRRGRYRFEMLKKEQLQIWAEPLAEMFHVLQKDTQEQRIEEWEFVAFYVLVFVFLNCPNEKWTPKTRMNRKHLLNLDVDRTDYFVQLGSGKLFEVCGSLQKDQWAHCCGWLYGDMKSLRGVPEPVLHSLREWRAGRYNLFQLFFIPSAQELLVDQIQGKRCVTTLIECCQIPEPAETGRDVWSFCMHDLLHASHFFGAPEYLPAQRFLASFFLKAWEKSILKELLRVDSVLLKEFTYVAADMNAHPVYLVMSFYTAIRDHFKRRHLTDVKARMSPELETVWKGFWHSFLLEVSSNVELQLSWGSLADLNAHNRASTLKQIESFFEVAKNIEILV